MRRSLFLIATVVLALATWCVWTKTAGKMPRVIAVVAAPSAKPKAPHLTDQATHFRPEPITSAQQQTVEAIIRRHRGQTSDQLKQSGELQELMRRSMALVDLESPEMRSKLEQAVDDIHTATGAGHVSLDIGFGMIDEPKGRAWLEAAVAMDAQRMKDWIIKCFDGSIFEFSITPGLTQSSDGISVMPKQSGPPQAADAVND